jgi:hypothetical protein
VSIYEGFEAGDFRVAGVSCCLCDQPIESGIVDPVMLTVEARCDRRSDDGIGVQVMWCHAVCLEATGMTDLHVTRPEFWQTTDDDG